MMFERAILNSLRRWAQSDEHKPLILRGARQVGKTTVVNQFGAEFDNYLYLNLERLDDAKVFAESDDVNSILQAVFFLKGKVRKEGTILLFIDEIQCEPKAVSLLRYFYEELPEVHVIAAGSVLQSLLHHRVSFPVGRVEYLSLHPCSFNEFLGAMGESQLQKAHADCSLPSLLHDKVMQLFRQYSLIGGMPEVVSEYAKNRDILRLNAIYNSLLTSYNEDVEKYASTRSQVEVIRMILEYGWQMAGQAISFNRFGNSGYRSREVGEAFANLERAFLLELVYPVVSTELPMLPATRRSPKLIWLDGGLVNYAANIQRDVFESVDLMDAWRGNVAEQWVAQELAVGLSDSVVRKRHYWAREARSSTAEVDFIYQDGLRIVPIEVKSGHNAHLRSLHQFMDESAYDLAIRVWSGKYSVDDVKTSSGKNFRLVNLPFYDVANIGKIIRGL